mmetsp:Transcript_52343/g.145027  ORF Transcript_52343/g.145027 Transcript_52343/m.145027 type:complete len:409 (-) Transcript_52343:96-1322(-)
MAQRKLTLPLAFLAAVAIHSSVFVPAPGPAVGRLASAAQAHPQRRSLLGGCGLAAAEALSGVGEAHAFALKKEEKQVVDIFEKATLGVVHVKSTDVATARKGDQLEFLQQNKGGTGWIFDDKGHVATNLHVIGDVPSAVCVVFADGSEAAATVIGVDAGSDVAVLQVKNMPTLAAAACKPLVCGKSGELHVGQDVYAIGFPFNTDKQTFTRGIISGLDRTVPSAMDGRPIRGVIQTDAGINPGNSGGPLLNSDGEVIGMNTQILTSTGASVGIGLAVPSDTIGASVGAILKYGRVRRSTLGVLLGPDQFAKAIAAGAGGSIVAGFQSGSPAQAAGMQTSDIIVAVGQTRVKSVNDLYAVQDACEPGQTVAVSVLRPSLGQDEKVALQRLQFEVTLKEAQTLSLMPRGA